MGKQCSHSMPRRWNVFLTHGDAAESKAMAEANGFNEGSCQEEGAPQSRAGIARRQRPRLGCRRFRLIVED